MRRLCGILLAALLALSSTACGGPGQQISASENGAGTLPPSGQNGTSGEPSDESPLGDAGEGRSLVVYFSATGTTRAAAEAIAGALHADLFEIIPEIPYTSADLNYSDSSCRANREQQDDSARPAIAGDCVVENWEDYDVVYLGHPIWWGIPPKIMRTFAESCDWSGKTVVGFCTSGGSGYSNEGLPELTAGAVWLEGRRFSGTVEAGEILEWAEGLPLHREEEAAVKQIQVSFNGHAYTAALADNSSAEAFAELLEKNGGSITVPARDYGAFEKVGELPESLPQNNEPLETAAGDLILYQGSSIVLYYAENSWTFTRLGRLEGDLTELQAHLGEGDVEITYALLP